MILLDTSILIYASDPKSPHSAWARETIANAVASDGAAINAVTLAEICVGDQDPETAADRIRRWGIDILDVPSAASKLCAEAYRRYRERRAAQGGRTAPIAPLPDFFIGAHALVMGWELATADRGRFPANFASIQLLTP
jgi:predicted nucleic acid-binding protein